MCDTVEELYNRLDEKVTKALRSGDTFCWKDVLVEIKREIDDYFESSERPESSKF